MADYIKTTDAITTTWMLLNGMGYAAEDNPDMVKTVAAVFNTAPAADVVEVRHGRWLSKEYMYGDPDVGVEDEWVERLAEQSDYYAYCSVCGKDAEYNGEGSLVLSDYCPNCGAKMDLVTDCNQVKDGDGE